MLYILLQKTKEKTILPRSFYEVSIIPIPNPEKGLFTIESYRPICPMDIDGENLQQKMMKLNPSIF